MKIVKQSDLNKSFLVSQIEHLNQLPLCAAWDFYQINTLPDTSSDVVDFKGQYTFQELFKKAYPQLNFIQLSYIFNAWEKSTDTLPTSWEVFFQQYNLRFNENTIKTFKALSACSSDFLTWASSKKLSQRDLAPLRLLKDPQLAHPLEAQIATINPSKTLGTQILELGVDLLLMGKELSYTQVNAEKFLRELKSLRYPNTSSKDETRQVKSVQLPWPASVKADWIRKGDTSGIEIRFFAKSQQELEKKLNGLQLVSDTLAKSPEKLWEES